MSHKKKENKSQKRKQPIPPVSVHKTKKRKESELGFKWDKTMCNDER